ncbi:primosomal protein N' family DNA-binding protein, partial [Rubrivivax gelatinosus]
MTNRIAVAVETPQHTGVGVLDYLADQAWPPGTLLRVPLGRREVPGIVWHRGGDTELADDALRPAGPALEALPPLGEA